MKNLKTRFCLFLSLISLPGSFLHADERSRATSQVLLKPEVSHEAELDNRAPVAPRPMDISRFSPEKIVTPPTLNDDQRTQKILTSLVKQAGWFPNVKITVQSGMVSIQGTTKNAQQLEWLAKTADRLPGVIAVINQTTIETPPVTDLSPAWDELDHLIVQAKKALPLFVLAILFSVFFAFSGKHISRLTHSLWGKHISNPFLLSTVSRLTMLPIWALFFYLTLRTAGLSGLATTIIGGTGAASIVLGFAFKGIAENYLSGLLLAIRSPFTKGDEIQVQQYTGFVQSLNMRGTTIVDYDGNVVLIPNSIVIQSVIRNRTTSPSTRSVFTITIGFRDSIARAQEVIGGLIRSMPEILDKPAAAVNVDKLSASGVDLVVSFWFDATRSSGDRIKSLLVDRIKDELFAQGIHIPDVGREVVFADALQIMRGNVEPSRRSREQVSAVRAGMGPRAQQGVQAGQDATTQDIREIAEDVKILSKTVHTDLLQSN